MNQDEQHLRILSILHYVYAGLLAVGSMCGLLYVFIGTTFIASPPVSRGGPPPPPPEMGWLFIGIGGSVTLIGWIIAALVAVSGRFLGRRQHWIYCLVIACIVCMNMPIGTVLGVFTIVVLVRPTVKEMFGAIRRAWRIQCRRKLPTTGRTIHPIGRDEG